MKKKFIYIKLKYEIKVEIDRYVGLKAGLKIISNSHKLIYIN